jgi:hypothetical protein
MSIPVPGDQGGPQKKIRLVIGLGVIGTDFEMFIHF